jgi:hypothetical protein
MLLHCNILCSQLHLTTNMKKKNPGPDSILQYHGPIEFIKEDSKASHSDRRSHIEGDIIQKHKHKKIKKN